MDIKLNYIEEGEGFPLILLHGNGEDCAYFKNQLPFFSKNRRVIALDTRGHGKSERGKKPFTIRQFADDLFCFLEEQKIEKADILGFSDGGNIAMVFALKYPGKVRKLVLNGANLNGWGVKAHIQLPIVSGYYFSGLFKNKSEDALKNHELLGLMVNDPNVRKDELRALEADTLVIAGNRDMIKTSHTKLIAKNIPHSKLVIIEGDHFIANKKSDEFNRIVEEFLNS